MYALCMRSGTFAFIRILFSFIWFSFKVYIILYMLSSIEMRINLVWKRGKERKLQ